MKEYSIQFNNRENKIAVPDNWDVSYIKNTGNRIDREQIEEKIENPIGSQRIRDLVKNDGDVAIIIEDHTRPTPIKDILKTVLKELFEANIDKSRITIIGATAAHRKMLKDDFIKKIGEDIVNSYKVISHDILNDSDMRKVGDSLRGTPIYINKYVLGCKYKIGIGGISPHGAVGFGGGAKIILPGVAGFKSIVYNHVQLKDDISVGSLLKRPMRLDMEEAAGKVGLDFIIAGIIDHANNLIDVIAGNYLEAHKKGVEIARGIYSAKVNQADVVLACSYPLETDFFQACKGLFPANSFVKENGTIIWICSCIEGLGHHYLVERDKHYKEYLKKSFKNISDKSKIYFCSGNLNYHQINDYLIDEIIFSNSIKFPIEEVIKANKDKKIKATILYSSPFTIAGG